jgi:hypothetical protein
MFGYSNVTLSRTFKKIGMPAQPHLLVQSALDFGIVNVYSSHHAIESCAITEYSQRLPRITTFFAGQHDVDYHALLRMLTRSCSLYVLFVSNHALGPDEMFAFKDELASGELRQQIYNHVRKCLNRGCHNPLLMAFYFFQYTDHSILDAIRNMVGESTVESRFQVLTT